MSTEIGINTRREQIEKWRGNVSKAIDLLLAFPVQEIENDDLAVFRGQVATRIKTLAMFLACGEWGLFCEAPLTYPTSEAVPVTDAEVVGDDDDGTEADETDMQTVAALDFVPQKEGGAE